ncbi:hypothetical protein ACSLGG_31220 (plasmid) [Bacillus mycoides]|uniref:hypothetical protein n=1 Tax=Bacillus mycoides TaxID=1405 RepID=UPI003F753FF2
MIKEYEEKKIVIMATYLKRNIDCRKNIITSGNKCYKKKKREVKIHWNELHKKQLFIHLKEQMEAKYKRIVYTRYTNDCLIGIIGSNEDLVQVKEKLNIELSQEKILITHSQKSAQFLRYDSTILREQATAKTTKGSTKKNISN